MSHSAPSGPINIAALAALLADAAGLSVEGLLERIAEVLTAPTSPAHPAPVPATRFFAVEAWAAANNLGVNAVYQYMRRADPLPHVRQGRRKLVDDELALAWMRRNFGVGTKGAAS